MAKNIRLLKTGTALLKFFIALLILDFILVARFILRRPESYAPWIAAVAILALIEVCIFWIGIVLVYISSIQLGLKQRILGIALGWVPFANIYMLTRIVRICGSEIRTETEKYKLNESRKSAQVCKTKYPLLLVHGVFFRDFEVLNYWGRIPGELKKNGAVIYYGKHNSAAAVADSAKELEKRILDIVRETGCEKVNVIAHSKGGLEARMAASSLGMGNSIASITTIGTPHRGSKTIDKLLKAPDSLFNIASFAVDNWIGLIGDTKPDFYAVCKDFSTEYAERFNRENPDVPGVYYQSYAGVMKTPLSDINLSTANVIVRLIEGDNDGLVSVESAKWGDSFTLLTGRTNRGVSHYDEIDFRRAPLTSKKYGDGVADICDVYLSIINGLVKCGF